MQRGSFFVKEHVLANMLFMSYAQVNVFARKGRNWILRILHVSFYWKRHVFTIRVQTVGPVPHCMFDIVAATIGQQDLATGPPRPIHFCCCPQRKIQGALNQALRIATTEWGLTTQIILSSAYNIIDGQLVPVRGARTLIHAHNSGTTCLRVYVPSQKNDHLCMTYHPFHFVGEVLLHPIYVYIYIYIHI